MEVVRAACTHPFQIWFSSQVHMACVRQQKGAGGKTACLVWPNSWETAQDRLFVIFNRWFVFYALAAVAVLSDKKRSDNVQKRGKNEGLMCSSAETGSRHFHPCLGRVQMCRFSTWCACNWKQHLGGVLRWSRGELCKPQNQTHALSLRDSRRFAVPPSYPGLISLLTRSAALPSAGRRPELPISMATACVDAGCPPVAPGNKLSTRYQQLSIRGRANALPQGQRARRDGSKSITGQQGGDRPVRDKDGQQSTPRCSRFMCDV